MKALKVLSFIFGGQCLLAGLVFLLLTNNSESPEEVVSLKITSIVVLIVGFVLLVLGIILSIVSHNNNGKAISKPIKGYKAPKHRIGYLEYHYKRKTFELNNCPRMGEVLIGKGPGMELINNYQLSFKILQNGEEDIMEMSLNGNLYEHRIRLIFDFALSCGFDSVCGYDKTHTHNFSFKRNQQISREEAYRRIVELYTYIIPSVFYDGSTMTYAGVRTEKPSFYKENQDRKSVV